MRDGPAPWRQVEEVSAGCDHRHATQDGPVTTQILKRVFQREQARRAAIPLPIEPILDKVRDPVRDAQNTALGRVMADDAVRRGEPGLLAALKPKAQLLSVQAYDSVQTAGPDRTRIIAGHHHVKPPQIESTGNVTPERRCPAQNEGLHRQWSLTSG